MWKALSTATGTYPGALSFTAPSPRLSLSIVRSLSPQKRAVYLQATNRSLLLSTKLLDSSPPPPYPLTPWLPAGARGILQNRLSARSLKTSYGKSRLVLSPLCPPKPQPSVSFLNLFTCLCAVLHLWFVLLVSYTSPSACPSMPGLLVPHLAFSYPCPLQMSSPAPTAWTMQGVLAIAQLPHSSPSLPSGLHLGIPKEPQTQQA